MSPEGKKAFDEYIKSFDKELSWKNMKKVMSESMIKFLKPSESKADENA
jgi:hypothetical protein